MKNLIPPLRFGMVNDGIYRGGYPTLPNFSFLRRLRLNIIISLTPENPTQDLKDFAEYIGIELIHIPILRLNPLNKTLKDVLIQVIQVLINSKNYPIYIHCLDGRRVTGLVVLLLRKLQCWDPQSSFAEFFQHLTWNTSTLRAVDEPDRLVELEKMSRDISKFLLDIKELTIPGDIPWWLWNGKRNSRVPGFRFKFNPPLPRKEIEIDIIDTHNVHNANTHNHIGHTLHNHNDSYRHGHSSNDYDSNNLNMSNKSNMKGSASTEVGIGFGDNIGATGIVNVGGVLNHKYGISNTNNNINVNMSDQQKHMKIPQNHHNNFNHRHQMKMKRHQTLHISATLAALDLHGLSSSTSKQKQIQLQQQQKKPSAYLGR